MFLSTSLVLSPSISPETAFLLTSDHSESGSSTVFLKKQSEAMSWVPQILTNTSFVACLLLTCGPCYVAGATLAHCCRGGSLADQLVLTGAKQNLRDVACIYLVLGVIILTGKLGLFPFRAPLGD